MDINSKDGEPPLRKRRPCWRDSDAVSPVVGVMLMLVVTIIIAAVVSGFAGGIGSNSGSSTVASLAVTLFAGPEKNITIEHLGGDSLKTEELKIISTYTVPKKWGTTNLAQSGRVIKHTIDGSMAPIPENGLDTESAGYPFTPQITNDDSIVSTRTADRTFGTATLVPGGRLVFDRDYFLGFNTGQRTTYGFNEGVSVNVMIIHSGSQKVLYDRDVIVSW
ncbi:type IV pilin N-terminal domain-containing protein [Methanocalculus sp.]|uniref:type IV pilin N-terminal domain-containing protein n=1 Tax=Methanocalculus sp. TaxID=2004547 RepID=UPI00272400DF|nr:type IV pilin N-terminal domain-containing protein [Methanocalculus sp.]MDO8841288.1 type IV pilin N-terminal domain-containing protein [Methanocalculus sp.]